VIAGVVHRDLNGTFWFDDRPVRGPEDIPSGRAWAGTVWYAAPGIHSYEWASLLREGDVAFGPSPGEVMGCKIRTGAAGRGTIRVLDSRCWGVPDRDPNVCFREIQSIRAQARACDLEPKNSAAATAISAWMDRFDGKDDRVSLRQLPPRWRGLAHACMHAGPAAVLRASAPFAVHIDRKKAYLAALREPMPVLGLRHEGKSGGFYTHDDRRWSKIRKLEGFVEAQVRISGDPNDPAGLPSLPVHATCGTIYPKGFVRGTWTIRAVREAEDRGEVEVVSVEQFAYAPATEPIFAELADLFEQLPQPLQKRLYTRFWGKLGSRGGYVATKSAEPISGAIPASGLWWAWEGIEPWSPKARPTYRPDIAAFVLDANQRAVFRDLRRLAPGSVVATHVDAIWTTDLVGASTLIAEGSGQTGSWRSKRHGPIRFYGIGMYAHGDRLACSGYNPVSRGPLTPETLAAFVRSTEGSQGRNLLLAREWSADPITDASATSRPLVCDLSHHLPVDGPDVYSEDWTPGGWYRQADEMLARQAFAVDEPRDAMVAAG